MEGGWLEPRSKLNEKQSTIATHEAVGYYPMIDWKNKKDLITKWDDWLKLNRAKKQTD